MAKKNVDPQISMLLNAGSIYRIISYKDDKSKKPYRVLFSDKKTILEFGEQDPYTYHDCNYSAFFLNVFQDADVWKNSNENPCFTDATQLDNG